MNTKRVTLIFFALVGALILSSCTGGAAGRGSSWPGLAADDQSAYISDGAQIFAVRLSDGAELWRFPAKADAKISFYATPVLLGDGRLLVGSAGTDHCLYLIDSTKVDSETKSPQGSCIFNKSRDRWIASPLVIDNIAYAPNTDGYLYTIDLTKNEPVGEPLKITESGHLWSTPVTLPDSNVLYISSLDHHVYAVDIAAKKILWGNEDQAVDLGGSLPSSPSLSQDGQTLYVGSFDKKVFALDAATGRQVWSQPASVADWVWGSPAVAEGLIYAGDLAGNLYALDAASGAVSWSQKPDGPITGSPLLVGDQIIVTTESGSIHAYDAKTGQQAWEGSIKGKIYTAPVLAGDLILIAPLSSGAEYFLTAFSTNGSVRWNFKPE